MNLIHLIKPFFLVIGMTVLTLLVQSLAPESIEQLRYQQDAVTNGEWWRIFTANFTHSGWNHWALNITGLFLIDYLFQPLVNQIQRTLLLLFCMLINVLFIHYTLDMHWYVGLSGALHGFLVGGALLSFKQAKYFNLAIVLVVTIKLIAELNFEINQATADFIDANVVEEAHLYGAISAVLYFGIFILFNNLARLKNNPSN